MMQAGSHTALRPGSPLMGTEPFERPYSCLPHGPTMSHLPCFHRHVHAHPSGAKNVRPQVVQCANLATQKSGKLWTLDNFGVMFLVTFRIFVYFQRSGSVRGVQQLLAGRPCRIGGGGFGWSSCWCTGAQKLGRGCSGTSGQVPKLLSLNGRRAHNFI